MSESKKSITKYHFSLVKARIMNILNIEEKDSFVLQEVKNLKDSMDAGLGYSIEMSANYGLANLISSQFEHIRVMYNSLQK